MKKEKFPLFALLALTTAAFSAIIAELLPAGVLLAMSRDLDVPPSGIGQLVSYYALGTVITAIPGAVITARIPRKPLLLIVIAGFFISNVITACSHSYMLTSILRVIAGGFSGVLWPLMAGYATRMVSKKDTGKAIAIVMGGSTIALSAGLPFCTFLGDLIGWRLTFGSLSGLMILIFFWITIKIPTLLNDQAAIPPSISLLKIPGLKLVIITTFLTSLGMYVAYTYLHPIQLFKGISSSAGLALLLFGAGAMVGILLTGRFIDSDLRFSLLASMILAATSLLVISIFGDITWIFFTGVFCWGLAFGGLPSLLQTATVNVIQQLPELGSSVTVTVYNSGVFSGAFLGGFVLDTAGPGTVTWISFAFLALVIVLILKGHRFAFPRRKIASTNGLE